MSLAEERAPKGFVRIEEVIGREELEASAVRCRRVAGFATGRVNGGG